MRENNRNSIEKCRKKLPQFTTMNVIDGQAGLISYFSLIFYSLTIDNILNIIVLIILAGVSIAMVIGDNGIIPNAQNARRETEIANIKEKVQMDILEKELDNEGNIDKGEFIGILNEYFEGVPTEENLPQDLTTLTLQAKEEYGSNAINIGEIWNGTFGEGKTEVVLAEAITSTNYGDYIDYPIDLNGDGDTTNDWRIFYNNGTHVFIIAADYVKNDSIYLDNAGIGMTPTNTYKLYWNTAPTTVQTVEQNVLSLFKQSWADYSTNGNGRCVSTLLNTNNWDGFVNGNYADYAIGVPTIEMWVASYNAKGYTPLYTNTNTNGYYIGNTEGTTEISYDLTRDVNTGYHDTLYFPHQDSIDDCWGYWLASPNANGTSSLVNVDCNGNVGSSNYDSGSLGVRPVVSLKSEITATRDANDIWRF